MNWNVLRSVSGYSSETHCKYGRSNISITGYGETCFCAPRDDSHYLPLSRDSRRSYCSRPWGEEREVVDRDDQDTGTKSKEGKTAEKSC